MTMHLEDRKLAQWLEGEADAAPLEHLEACEPCRKEAVDFRRSLTAFREAIFAEGKAREFRWTPPAEAPAARRPAWGTVLAWSLRAALAACVLAAVLWMRPPKPAPAPAASDAADDALLQKIQSDLSQQAPDALQPAESFVAQMTVQKSSNSQGGKQ